MRNSGVRSMAVALGTGFTMLVIACSSSDPISSASSTEKAQGAPQYTETVVTLNPDGTTTVHVNRLTKEEVLNRKWAGGSGVPVPTATAGDGKGTEQVGSTAQAIGTVTCDGYEGVILTDGTCSAGGYNAICFSGTGWADLSTYCRTYNYLGVCTSHWNGNVQTWDGATDSGELVTTHSCVTCFPNCKCGGEVDFPANDTCYDNNGQIVVNNLYLF